MITEEIETYIHNRDKSSLYRSHMKKEISDDELVDAIVKIDDSVKPKDKDWIKLILDIIFPSTRHIN
jgi:hypothetical protein